MSTAEARTFWLCPGNGCEGAGVARESGTCPNCQAARVEVDGRGEPVPRKAPPGPAIWDLVIADMRERDAIGTKRYGDRLRPESPNDALQFAYEEALDLAAYLRQEIHRRDGR